MSSCTSQVLGLVHTLCHGQCTAICGLIEHACMHAGHDHLGGYAYHGGIHWLTVQAILEGELAAQS